MFKKLISIHQLCPKSGLKHSVVHFEGIGMIYFCFFYFFLSKYVQKTNFYPSIMSKIRFKTFTGSLSRYLNEIVKVFLNIFLSKYVFLIKICASMRF